MGWGIPSLCSASYVIKEFYSIQKDGKNECRGVQNFALPKDNEKVKEAIYKEYTCKRYNLQRINR